MANNQNFAKAFRSGSPNDRTRSELGDGSGRPTAVAAVQQPATAFCNGTSPFNAPSPLALKNRPQEQERRTRRVIIGSALWLSCIGLVLVAFIVWALTSDWDISPEAARAYSKLRPDRRRTESPNDSLLANE
ncbi:hypothetical protein HPB52_012306 [Rhipicephalus sanguineus]|uniref:Transmembrane protein n=1 Tax=Rhipicephalus sanguineus TaxID=34632 RepID=A0A9D4SUE6_RHISA|nr:hypothetical protein HPB52_012306 [Rhipicephalus sanguineus]